MFTRSYIIFGGEKKEFLAMGDARTLWLSVRLSVIPDHI